MTNEEKVKALTSIVAELYNAIADVAEGGNYIASQRLQQVGPHLQKLISDIDKTPAK